MKRVVILVTIFVYFSGVTAQNNIGDECYTNKNITGTCTLPNDCRSLKNISKQDAPTICGFMVNSPIICCPPVITENITEIDTNGIIGDECYTNKNITGTCTLPHNCRSLKNISKQDAPTHCGFMVNSPIICCPPVIPENETRTSVIKCNIYSDCKLLNKKGHVRNQRDTDSETTQTTEFPHMAAIGWKLKNGGDAFLCEGSLVSEDFILTAAHCTSITNNDLKSSAPNFARLGERNLITSEGNKRQDLRITDVFTHPKYSDYNRYHDIGLMKLEKPIVRSQFINPACLWRSRNIPYEEGIITGWGKLDFLEGDSNVLRRKTVEIIDGSDCSNRHRYPKKLFPDNILSEQLCATNPNATRFTCHGDTGSPLQIMDGHSCSFHLIGITSYGAACAGPNLPAVYTRISSYIAWIEETVWEM